MKPIEASQKQKQKQFKKIIFWSWTFFGKKIKIDFFSKKKSKSKKIISSNCFFGKILLVS
jgi:hypothetical protein